METRSLLWTETTSFVCECGPLQPEQYTAGVTAIAGRLGLRDPTSWRWIRLLLAVASSPMPPRRPPPSPPAPATPPAPAAPEPERPPMLRRRKQSQSDADAEQALAMAISAATGRERDRLVTEMLDRWDRRVRAVARAWSCWIGEDDLLAAGRCGVLEALSRRGDKPWSVHYTTLWVRNYIVDFVRLGDRPVVEPPNRLSGDRPARQRVPIGLRRAGAVVPNEDALAELLDLVRREPKGRIRATQRRVFWLLLSGKTPKDIYTAGVASHTTVSKVIKRFLPELANCS